jgi:hypothetical protein
MVLWAGDWTDRVDYMHFQVSRAISQQLAYLDLQSALKLYNLTIQYPDSASELSADTRWFYLYKLYPKHYIEILTTYFPALAKDREKRVFTTVYQALAND